MKIMFLLKWLTMELSERILLYFVLTTIIKDVLGALECSQCLSDEFEDCAVNPPSAEPCSTYQQKKGPVHCMVAKKTNASGSIIQFIRGCTGVWTGSGCMDQSDDTKLCYEICSTDNCNSGNTMCLFTTHLLVPFIYFCNRVV